MTEKPKDARDMTDREFDAALRQVLRPAPFKIPVIEKNARDMTDKEYAEAKRKLGIQNISMIGDRN